MMSPDAVYVVTAKTGGPALYSSWSRSHAVTYKNRIPCQKGSFIVVKYVLASTQAKDVKP